MELGLMYDGIAGLLRRDIVTPAHGYREVIS